MTTASVETVPIDKLLRCSRFLFYQFGPPTQTEVYKAELHRALYRVGIKTPYTRKPGNWIAEDPPTWEFSLCPL